jgi:hypothetical protein
MPLNEANASAAAFPRSGDPDVGEFHEAVILKTFGQVLEDFTVPAGIIWKSEPSLVDKTATFRLAGGGTMQAL